MALLNKHEQLQVAEAIARVERRTDAELVTVLTARSDDYAYVPLVWAGLVALLLPGVDQLLPRLAGLAQWIVAEPDRDLYRCRADHAYSGGDNPLDPKIPYAIGAHGNLARRQFLEQNLHRTLGGTGVLIFVLEAERYVEILVDRGDQQSCGRHCLESADRGVHSTGPATVRPCKGSWVASKPAANCLATHVPVTQTLQ